MSEEQENTLDEALESVSIDEMDKNQLGEYALAQFGEVLNLKQRLPALRKQVLAMMAQDKEDPVAAADVSDLGLPLSESKMTTKELFEKIDVMIDLKVAGIQLEAPAKSGKKKKVVQRSEWLRNPDNGRVVRWTAILAGRGDLIPCDENGKSV